MAFQNIPRHPRGSDPANMFPLDPTLHDPNTPLFVATAIGVSTAVGASAGATIGLMQNMNPFQTSLNMGTRWLVGSSTFFGFREYLVSPLLVHNQVTDLHAQQFRQLSDKQLGKLPEKLQLTRSDRRYQRMIDSGATGALVGSVASWGLTGRRAAIRGGVTGAVACSLLQLTANSLRMLKSDYLDPHEPDPPRQGQSDHSVGHSIDEAQLPPQSSSSVQSQDGSNPTKGQVEGQSRLQSWLSSLWQYAPMKRVSDPDYLKTLNARLATVDAKLMKLEDEELKLYQKVQEAEHRKREGKDRMV